MLNLFVMIKIMIHTELFEIDRAVSIFMVLGQIYFCLQGNDPKNKFIIFAHENYTEDSAFPNIFTGYV